MNIKQHFGILFLILLSCYFAWFFKPGSMDEFEAWVPCVAAVMCWAVVEGIGWAMWWLFCV